MLTCSITPPQAIHIPKHHTFTTQKFKKNFENLIKIVAEVGVFTHDWRVSITALGRWTLKPWTQNLVCWFLHPAGTGTARAADRGTAAALGLVHWNRLICNLNRCTRELNLTQSSKQQPSPNQLMPYWKNWFQSRSLCGLLPSSSHRTENQ